jgi:hypothetical protein
MISITAPKKCDVLQDLEKAVVPIIARRDGRYTVVGHLVQHDLLLIVSRHLCLQPFDRGLKRFGIEIPLPFSVRESLVSLGFFHGREIRKIVAHKVVVHVDSKRFESNIVLLKILYRREPSYIADNSLCKEFQ